MHPAVKVPMNSNRPGFTSAAWKVLAAFLCALVYMAPSHATSVVPLYLEEMIDTSSVAFEATCTGNRTEVDAETGFVVTKTTFAVHDVLKGSVGTIHVIKQIGGSLPDEKLQYRIEGIPTFDVGKDYVVFLAGVSAAGFSSPIGLQQGKFSVRVDGATRKVRNGRDFQDMTSRMSGLPSAAKAGIPGGAVSEMDLDDFKQLVRSHLRGVQR